MELDYSGAKTLEEKKAIHKAFWDNIHKEREEGKWQPITREEFDRQIAELREYFRKKREQKDRQDTDGNNNAT